MKTWTFTNWSLRLAVVALLSAAGCVRESVNSAPAIVTNPDPTALVEAAAVPVGNPPPEAAAQDLANAPAKIVSTPAAVPAATSLSVSAAEVARLAQSGVDENVMLAFVNNSGSTFNVGSDQIIYLSDIGVPGNVVTAMIQRDQVLKTASPAPVAPAPTYTYQPAPVQNVAPEMVEAQPAPVVAQEAPPPQVNVTATYFYDTLSPYGNWIEVEGYGRCWQPSVVVADRGWTPYCDRGHWVYSDCGWYWASDYSWGWAPFHYGRWFRHNFWGWCWAPDTIWGPSWVSWRYNSGYCGWAPLPPTACYQPGGGFTYYGRSVGVSFGFGLGAEYFTFVAADRFCDPQPFRHRIPHHQVTQIFNNTVIINPVVEDRGNARYHRGIPAKHIADATHVEIKPVKIQETTSVPAHGRGENQDRNHGTLTVFRPPLPEPPAHVPGNRLGEGIKPATPATVIHRFDSEAAMHRGIPHKTDAPVQVSTTPTGRHADPVPVFRTPPATVSAPPRSLHGAEKPAPEISTEMRKEMPRSVPTLREASPAVAAPKAPPVQNNLLLRRQPTVTIPQPHSTPSPVLTPPVHPAQPAIHEGTYRSEPRQENIFTAPTKPTAPVQIQPAPQVRTYTVPVMPPSRPQPAAREQHEVFAPAPSRSVPVQVPPVSAPPAPRFVAPPPMPHMEAPRVESRPAPVIQAPPVSASRPAASSNGKQQDSGNPRDKR